jgi:hypothetical protein
MTNHFQKNSTLRFPSLTVVVIVPGTAEQLVHNREAAWLDERLFNGRTGCLKSLKRSLEKHLPVAIGTGCRCRLAQSINSSLNKQASTAGFYPLGCGRGALWVDCT